MLPPIAEACRSCPNNESGFHVSQDRTGRGEDSPRSPLSFVPSSRASLVYYRKSCPSELLLHTPLDICVMSVRSAEAFLAGDGRQEQIESSRPSRRGLVAYCNLDNLVYEAQTTGLCKIGIWASEERKSKQGTS
jgi:hypothetical protein